MYTGIVQKVLPISECSLQKGILHYSLPFSRDLLQGLEKGASVAIDGVCQTVVDISSSTVFFEATSETLARTTLNRLTPQSLVNVERSACLGDEIGGHLLSGHVIGTAEVLKIEADGKSSKYFFAGSSEWMKYLFTKGFIAIDGASLTLVDVIYEKNLFSVHLIPETLKRTTLGVKKPGHLANIEVDPHIQALVETAIRFFSKS